MCYPNRGYTIFLEWVLQNTNGKRCFDDENSFGIRIVGFWLMSTRLPRAVAHGLAWFEPYGLFLISGFDLVISCREFWHLERDL